MPYRKSSTRRTQQTVRVNGVRTTITTNPNGKVTTKPALPEEWELQAEQIKRLRAMPEHGKTFLLAGDQNAARRGPKARSQAIAAGMTAGEPDVRVYLLGARVAFIENKVGEAALLPSQVTRHRALKSLGHTVAVVRAINRSDAADQAERLVRTWITSNDNSSSPSTSVA